MDEGKVTAVNPNNVEPLYKQIAAVLYSRIEAGTWSANEKIPSETMLMEEFDVSRITIKKAVSELTDSGYLVRSRGRGTFVAPVQGIISAQGDVGFTRSCHMVGKKAQNVVLEAGMVLPSIRYANFLGLKEGEKGVMIRRLRKVDGQPTVVEIIYYHPRFEWLLKEDLTGSVTDIVIAREGAVFGKQERTVEACSASEEESGLLDVEKDTPMLLIRDQQYDLEGRPLTIAKQVFCTNYLKLYL